MNGSTKKPPSSSEYGTKISRGCAGREEELERQAVQLKEVKNDLMIHVASQDFQRLLVIVTAGYDFEQLQEASATIQRVKAGCI